MTNKESNLIKGLIEQHDYCAESASELVEDLYIGQYNSLADYAKEWIKVLNWRNKNKSWYVGNRPFWSFVSNHLDYVGLGADLEKDGQIKSLYLKYDEKMHIFGVA